MIAQILAMRRRGLAPAPPSSSSDSDSSRVMNAATRGVQIALAIALLPALATMLVVGGLGAAAVAAATTVARVAEGAKRPPSR